LGSVAESPDSAFFVLHSSFIGSGVLTPFPFGEQESFCQHYDIRKTTDRCPAEHQKSGSRSQKETHCGAFAEKHANCTRQTRRQGGAQ
jgi:hypothetical protein